MSSPDSVQQRTFQLLRRQIIDMELLPGTAVSVYELSEKLRVSRTPVREAFIRLAAESLVTVLPQRGTLISKIDFARVRQERFLREALELRAVSECLRNLDREKLDAMRASLKLQREAAAQKDAARMLRHDDVFHSIIFDAAGQQLSWGVVERMSGHDRRVRLMMVADGGEAEHVLREHEAIVEALERGDAAGAATRSEQHLKKIIFQESKLRETYPDFFEPREPIPGIV